MQRRSLPQIPSTMLLASTFLDSLPWLGKTELPDVFQYKRPQEQFLLLFKRA